MKKGKWSKEEDDLIKNHIEKYGIGRSWQGLSNTLGLQRCGRSCRSRWLNYLRPGLKHGNFTPAEDKIICEMYSKRGSCWSVIAAELPGRTDLAIKNYWNCTLKKRFPRAARSSRGHRRTGSTWSDAASPYLPLVVYSEEESISSATPDLALVVYNEGDSTTTGSQPSHAGVDDKPVSASSPPVQARAQPPPLAADALANEELPIAAVPISGLVRIEAPSPSPPVDQTVEMMDIGCVPMSPLPLELFEPGLPCMAFLPPVADFDDIDSFLSFFDD